MRRGALPRPLAAAVLVGLVLRTLVWWPSHNFRGVLEYDDGVYYGAAKLLSHGLWPYSDFTIVHPPLLTLSLMPAALVGDLFGDPTGMAAARVEMQLVAVANILLVYLVARRLPSVSPRIALTAAWLYALMPNAVIAEHTALLEPMVSCACLLSVWFVLSHRFVAGGALAAAGIGLKLFGGAYALAVVVFLLWNRRWRAAAVLSASTVASVAVIAAVFAWQAPHAAWHDVVDTQLHRPINPNVEKGFSRVADMLGFGHATVPLGLLLIAVLLVSSVLGLRRDRSSATLVWLVVLVVGGLAFATSPTYFPHYGAFLAPPVAVLASRLWSSGRVGAAALAATVVVFGIGDIADVSDLRGQGDLRALGQRIPSRSCVYFDAISLALAADVYRVPSPSCPSYVDGRGVALTQSTDWSNATSFYPFGFVADAQWQRDNVDQMRHSDFLLLRADAATFPEWSASTRLYATTHFSLVDRHKGGRQPYELWHRTQPG